MIMEAGIGLREELYAHLQQTEDKTRGGIIDTLKAYQLRIVTEEYHGMHTFEQFIDGE